MRYCNETESNVLKIGLFGTKSEALYLYKNVKNTSCENIYYFIDNDSGVVGKKIDDIPIISFDELLQLYPEKIDTVIIAVRGTYSRLSIMNQLFEAGIYNVGIFKFSAHDFGKEIIISSDGSSEFIVWLNQIKKPVLPYLETNVMDSCNLKCKGCSHFSNLFKEGSRGDFEQFKSDLNQISKKSYVIQFRLLGGEPLLNGELPQYVAYSRKVFPDADINVVTNGLLIPKQDKVLFEVMTENKVGFHISQYKPTLNMKDKIINILTKNNVDYFFERGEIEQFGKNLSMKGTSDDVLAQKACISKGCRFLRNGRIYKCPIEGLIDKFAIEYNYQTVLEVQRGFDIYDEAIDWNEKLDDYLQNPVMMCKYCAEYCELFDWEVRNRPQEKDWLV